MKTEIFFRLLFLFRIWRDQGVCRLTTDQKDQRQVQELLWGLGID